MRRDRRGGPKAGRELNPEALALLERFGAQMLATARRYSASAHDAEDAYQRAAEILLTHRPTGTDDELCRWLRTTTKHEALAINGQRARVMPAGESESVLEPAGGSADAHEQVERFERLQLGAEALKRLKPQEVRCLLLKAEGYSYQEICETTGFSYTKVNRCLTEGRRSFLERVAGIEAGAECERLAPHLSALADNEADVQQIDVLHTHLRTCLSCRHRLREFRAVPSRVAALVPPAALVAGSGGGGVRSALEAMVGAAQHKAATLGERAYSVIDLVGGGKAAAVAASAMAVAGGGAATVDRLAEREATAAPPAETIKVGDKLSSPAPAPKPQIAPPPARPPKPPAPSEPAGAPGAGPPAAAGPPPRASAPTPANEFGPGPIAPPPAAPPPAPAPAAPSGGGAAGGGGSGAGAGEFGP